MPPEAARRVQGAGRNAQRALEGVSLSPLLLLLCALLGCEDWSVNPVSGTEPATNSAEESAAVLPKYSR